MSTYIRWAVTALVLALATIAVLHPRPLEAVARSCPVVGSFPVKDFTAGPGKKLDEILDKYDIPHDFKIYPGARHSFFNDRSRNYNAEAANDSWERVKAFFKTHIG